MDRKYFDTLRKALGEVSEWSLQWADMKTREHSALKNNTTINFNLGMVKNKFIIISCSGGDRVAHGEWYDLECDDDYLLECLKDLEQAFDKVDVNKVWEG